MASKPHRNRLLARLSPKEFDALRPHLAALDLPLRFVLERPGRNIEHVYFPEAGIASVVATQKNGTNVEVGLIGCEGMSGVAVTLGNHQSPNETYMQVAGEGQRIAADTLRAIAAKNPGVQKTMLRYVQAFLTQASHTAICNARSRIDERLARWILMAHDRVAGPTIPLTHEFIALMLGVRRAGVTETLRVLVTKGSREIGSRRNHGARPQGAGADRGRCLRRAGGRVPPAIRQMKLRKMKDPGCDCSGVFV